MKRRVFIKGTAASALAFAAPTIIPGSALGLNGRPAPSERIVMAAIGVGGQGQYDLSAFLTLPEVQMVALCDVDVRHLDVARKLVDEIANRSAKSGQIKPCDGTGKFEEILSRGDLDAVLVATPDHWHSIIAINAMRAGLDVYCEKPLAYSMAEGRAVVEASKRYGRVVQTGTQRRYMEICRRGCELVRNGRIGRLHTVRIGLPKGFAIQGGDFSGNPKVETPPEGFDYDRWLGPAPWEPYAEGRCHFNFRWILDYGLGYISDWGAHFMDVGQWGIGADDSGPTAISGKATFPSEGLYDAPEAFVIEYTYANGVKMIASTEEQLGMKFEGEEGWVFVEPDVRPVLEASSHAILTSVTGPGEIHLRRSPGHHQDFIDCVKSRGETAATAEIGHRSATVCQLGAIACVLGRDLKWDPVREVILDDDHACGMLTRPMRAPWRL